MSLSPGTRLGVYSITAQIGQRGMGEVYRARDTTLDRDVAIKVLPERTGRGRPRTLERDHQSGGAGQRHRWHERYHGLKRGSDAYFDH